MSIIFIIGEWEVRIDTHRDWNRTRFWDIEVLSTYNPLTLFDFLDANVCTLTRVVTNFGNVEWNA
ncbi:MAG: Uncharacterised protein [Marine Group II euryarchaeote MED-G33]|nr:MAG: Uncharacterised protein [Marine Group II euryarchaeote MED-G33]